MQRNGRDEDRGRFCVAGFVDVRYPEIQEVRRASDMGAKETFAHCLSEGILGVGWRAPGLENSKNFDKYLAEALPIHDTLATPKYIYRWVREGDLIWTRDITSQYFLARVTSGWEYFTTQDSREKDVDVANIVRCDFTPVALDEVPGKVVACFRPPRTIQEISNPTAIEYSKYLWNFKSGTETYVLDDKVVAQPDVFALLDDEETEDLVFLYLQTIGWLVVPNSRKSDTMAFEYLVVKRESAEQADVQVKTGDASLTPGDYVQHPRKVFLFQSNARYIGPPPDNVTCLTREAILDLVEKAARWLPVRYRRKMEMLRPIR